MIYVNIFNITPDQKQIQVSVETKEGKKITSLKLWTQDTYTDQTKSVDLNGKIQGINSKEVFLINISDIFGTVTNNTYFTGIYFLEIKSDDTDTTCSTCSNPMIAVTANLNFIKEFILNKVLELSMCEGSVFKDSICNGNSGMDVVNISILLEQITSALSFGYYDEAVEIYNSLLKIYNISPSNSKCSSCNNIGNPLSNNGLGYGTLSNVLILT